MTAPVIVWFRRNLRVSDNDALDAAVETGQPLLPVYIHDSNEAGAASNWWLHLSLESLAADLARLGAPLLVLSGSAAELIPALAQASGAARLYFANGYTALASAEQEAVTAGLPIDFEACDDYYLHAPGTVKTAEGAPYRIFTPFWKACQVIGEPRRPQPAPESLRAFPPGVLERVERALPARRIADLGLLPHTPDWAGGLRGTWQPGEAGGLARLESFGSRIHEYADGRDRPDLGATSRLSPHLHFGEVSVRQVWHHANDLAQGEGRSRGADAWLRQLYWREFSGHLLFHFPELPAVPLRKEYERFPWARDNERLHAWQRGRTGYPIIDAGMRELWSTGWMHNRVRMIAASFLVKNLLIPWQAGADWFLDTLVDADLANNSTSWQWVAGCGTDAAPYFRIFNPVTQGRKFDPNGDYIRRWLPELRNLPDEDIHEPWLADGMTLRLAKLSLGADYPEPIVELSSSRERALDAYRELRSLIQSPATSPGSSAG